MNSYRRLHEILSKLEEKRLICGTLWSSSLNCGCAMGHVVPESERLNASTVLLIYGGPRRWCTPGIQAAMEREGFSTTFAEEIETLNDNEGSEGRETDEERYTRVMAYLEARFDEPV